MFQVNKGHTKSDMVYDIIAKIKLDMCITIKNIVLKYENAGNDLIEDFTVGNTSTNADADVMLKASAFINIQSILVTLLTSQ
jgi:hypothetical protein